MKNSSCENVSSREPISGLIYYAVFTAVFAILAAYVFWGTWSTSVAPVMPDCATVHPLDYGTRIGNWFTSWLQNGSFLPSDLSIFLLSPYVWQELQYVFAIYFAALGMAYFLRGQGLPPVACYGAGLFLGFSGYWLTLFSAGHAGWFSWMTYGVFAFGLCDRAVRGGRWLHWIALGAVLAWSSFRQPDLWLLFTVFTAIYFIWCCARERKVPSWKGILIAACFFILIGAPSFMDAFSNALSSRDKQIENSKSTMLGGGGKVDDAESRWIFATNWSMPPEDTLEFFIPRIHGDTSCQMTLALGRQAGKDVRPYTGRLGRPLNAPSGNYRQHSLYVGWVTCLLALVGIVMGIRKRRWEVVFFTVAAFMFWLFAMGRFCEPVYRLVYALPFGDYLRAPVKWHHLTEFCLVVLAGYGLYASLELKFMQGRRGLLIASALAFLGACDLARVAHLYCAPMDIAVVKAANPAADVVLKHGGGKVVDFIQRGQGSVAWAFSSHNVEVTGNPSDNGVRFVWVAIGQLKDANLSAWLRSKNAVEIGSYAVTEKSIRNAPRQLSNVVLMELPNVPVPKLEELPAKKMAIVLGLISMTGTVFATLFCAVSVALKRFPRSTL